jgi:hypothetical protein
MLFGFRLFKLLCKTGFLRGNPIKKTQIKTLIGDLNPIIVRYLFPFLSLSKRCRLGIYLTLFLILFFQQTINVIEHLIKTPKILSPLP